MRVIGKRRNSRSARKLKNAALTRALSSMKESREDNETTEIHPLILIGAVLLALFLIARMLKGGMKLPGVGGLSQQTELPGT